MELRYRILHIIHTRDMKPYGLSKISGINKNTLIDYLNGETKNITYDNVQLIAKSLNMSIAELIGEAEEKYFGKVKELADIASQLDLGHVELLLLNAKVLLDTYKESSVSLGERVAG